MSVIHNVGINFDGHVVQKGAYSNINDNLKNCAFKGIIITDRNIRNDK
jgi:hypothetical protein